MATAARLAWYRKKRWWALIATPFVLFAVVFLFFDPLVEWLVRKELGKVKGYEVTIEHAKLQPLKLNLAIEKMKVMKRSAGGEREPFFYVRHFELSVLWRELLHQNVVARLDLDAPKVNLIAAKSKDQEQLNEAPDLAKQLNDLLPMRADRIQIRRGELTYIDKTTPDVPKIWLHELEATVENLSTRAALARGAPTVVAVSSKLQKSGELSVWVTADPLAKGLWFSGQAKAVGLDMKDFHDLVASKSGLAIDEGTLDVFAEFSARGTAISGGVRPVLKNAKVVQAKKGVDNWLKKGLADAALKIFSDRVEGRNAVGTTIPIEGKVTSPTVQTWPTVLGVVRNAFVAGVTESYERLPPPVAQGREGPVKQAIDALDRGKRAPRAQPENKP